MTPLTHSGLLYLWLTLFVVIDTWLGIATPETPIRQYMARKYPLRSLVQPIILAGLLTYLVYLVQP